MDEKCNNPGDFINNLKNDCVNNYVENDVIKTGNSLVLALEDMVDTLGGNGRSQRVYDTNYKESVTLAQVKSKAVSLKELLTDFQTALESSGRNIIKDFEEDLRSYKTLVNYYRDEVLSDWLLITEQDKAIEDTYDVCYKTRELIRKLEHQR
jgi:hypothetical protein